MLWQMPISCVPFVIPNCVSVAPSVSYSEKRMQIRRCHPTQQTQRLHVSWELSIDFTITEKNGSLSSAYYTFTCFHCIFNGSFQPVINVLTKLTYTPSLSMSCLQGTLKRQQLVPQPQRRMEISSGSPQRNGLAPQDTTLSNSSTRCLSDESDKCGCTICAQGDFRLHSLLCMIVKRPLSWLCIADLRLICMLQTNFNLVCLHTLGQAILQCVQDVKPWRYQVYFLLLGT